MNKTIDRIKFYLINNGLKLVVDNQTGNILCIPEHEKTKQNHIEISVEQIIQYDFNKLINI